MNAAPTPCRADYFDGLQARAQPVRLTIEGEQLHIRGEGISLHVPVRQVQWPERQRHGQRQAHLPGQGLLSTDDAAAWDAWARASGLHESTLVHWMQSWRHVGLSMLLLVVVLFVAYRWGTPWAARAVLTLVPAATEAQLGDSVLAQVEAQWLLPSKLPAERQAALRRQFEQAVQRSQALPGAEPLPGWVLHFRAARQRSIGANAFALPGGHIVCTDELVHLLADRPDVLMAVLGHELGHVQQRHGMRLVVQTALLGALSSVVIGDFSTVLASAPAMLGQLAYSREFELEADQAAARLMRANGIPPEAFGLLFERIRAQRSAATGGATVELPIGLSTHPPDAERVRRMQHGAD
ncbi:MAG: M48 family metallopeptidase [Burkholderiales bacterium]|nr:M48 family metallopeptidase [Burkholderiales bacterium]